MKSRLWLNLALFVAVLLLAAVLFFKPGVKTEHQPQSLTSLKADEIQHVYIRRQHGRDIELKKEGARWWMQKPVKMPADAFAVTSLLKLAESAVHSRHDLLQLDRKTYGLDLPRASITFNQDITINFGATEPLHKRRYLNIADSLFTSDDLFYYQLASDFSRYLDPVLLPKKSKITQLILPDARLELKSGSWHRLPAVTHLSADADVELIEAWQNAAALKIELDKDYRQLKANVQIYLEGNDAPLLMNYRMENDSHYLTRLDNRIRYTLPVDIAIKLALYHEPVRDNMQTNTGNDVSEPTN